MPVRIDFEHAAANVSYLGTFAWRDVHGIRPDLEGEDLASKAKWLGLHEKALRFQYHFDARYQNASHYNLQTGEIYYDGHARTHVKLEDDGEGYWLTPDILDHDGNTVGIKADRWVRGNDESKVEEILYRIGKEIFDRLNIHGVPRQISPSAPISSGEASLETSDGDY